MVAAMMPRSDVYSGPLAFCVLFSLGYAMVRRLGKVMDEMASYFITGI
jgi:cobalamin biosynthesis protein CobD/CbiB